MLRKVKCEWYREGRPCAMLGADGKFYYSKNLSDHKARRARRYIMNTNHIVCCHAEGDWWYHIDDMIGLFIFGERVKEIETIMDLPPMVAKGWRMVLCAKNNKSIYAGWFK